MLEITLQFGLQSSIQMDRHREKNTDERLNIINSITAVNKRAQRVVDQLACSEFILQRLKG